MAEQLSQSGISLNFVPQVVSLAFGHWAKAVHSGLLYNQSTSLDGLAWCWALDLESILRTQYWRLGPPCTRAQRWGAGGDGSIRTLASWGLGTEGLVLRAPVFRGGMWKVMGALGPYLHWWLQVQMKVQVEKEKSHFKEQISSLLSPWIKQEWP